MNDYVNENEQWEAIKAWWKKNGIQLIVVMIIGLAVGFGWRYWESHRLNQKEAASQLFDQLLSVQSQDPTSDMVERITQVLLKDYSNTVYAPLAVLFEAKTAVAKNDLPQAEQKLQWALEHIKPPELKQITRIRLARLLLAEKKPDQAMALLDKIDNPGFSAVIEQVKGDIYLTQGQTAKAKEAYQNALNGMPATSSLRPYVEMELNQLPASKNI